jgi:putative ATP-dependent endonuclease of OLD family
MPEYIIQAIHFAHGKFPRSLIVRILQYRAEYRYGADVANLPAKQLFLQEINRFAQGDIGLAEFRITIGRLLPGDPIIVFLGKLQ